MWIGPLRAQECRPRLTVFDAVATGHDATLGIIGDGPERDALGGAWPSTPLADHTRKYDWDAIAERATTAYRRAIDGAW